MFLNINFQYIKTPVHLHITSTQNWIHFTTPLFYTMLIMNKDS